MTDAPMLSCSILMPEKNWTFRPVNAAVAIIVVDHTMILMQHRDTRQGLLYPGYWGFFGGGINAGEQPIDALKRELYEEIRLTIDAADYLTAVDSDFSFCGKGWSRRHYYVVHISGAELARLELHEGDEMKTFSIPDILNEEKVMPFDAWVLWMYANKTALSE